MNKQHTAQVNTENRSSVLVVDDNEMNRDMLVRRLRPFDYYVEVACDGGEALDILNKRAFDLVLLDIMMPIMDGYEVLKEMKANEKLKDIPVIMITALDDAVSAARCIDMGAEDYLTKPFDPTLLKARVTACLERKYLHDQEINYRSQIEEYNNHLEERVRQQVEVITSSQLGAIFAMSKLAITKMIITGKKMTRYPRVSIRARPRSENRI